MPIRRFDDNVYSRLEFLKAVSHSSDLHIVTDATDLDSDPPDDDKQALMPMLQPSTRLMPVPWTASIF